MVLHGQGPTTGPAPSPPSPQESKLRARFLRDVERDVQGRLKASLHHARFIDLGIEDDPAAVKPPWGYYNPEEKETYASVRDAFEQSNGRLLLLGDPGAGKTTAVLHIALELLRVAAQSPEAPVPLIVNLSKFRLPKPFERRLGVGGLTDEQTPSREEGQKRAFEHWLTGELAAYPGFSRSTAREWLYDGRIAALLDGLDEFNDERRAELAATLNETFLRDHPDLPVVICSRTNEYKVLASNEKSRLQLEAAVHLQPLSEPQIAAYLRAAKAEGLLDALAADAALRELSKTPLTLSMLVLAYGGRSLEALPGRAGLSETRLHLFEAYVERMLQRQARRRCQRPFDDVVSNDVPVRDYAYHPDSINRWLGWLAVTLSVRMRTSFSSGSLTRILHEGKGPGGQWLNFCIAYWAIGALMALILAGVCLTIVPVGAALTAAAIIATGALLTPALGTARDSWISGLSLTMMAWGMAIVGAAAILSHMLAPQIPGLSPHLFPPLLLATAFIVTMDGEEDLVVPMGGGLLISALIVAASASSFSPMPWLVQWTGPFWSEFLAGTLAWVPIAAAFLIAIWTNGEELFLLVGIFAAVVLASLAAVWLFAGLGWLPVLITATAAATALSTSLEPRRGITIVVLCIPFAIAGAVLAGPLGLFLALCACTAAGTVAYRIMNDAGRERGGWRLDRLFGLLDTLVLSPLAWSFLTLARRFPVRRQRFLNSAVDAFLLKRSRFEFEFVHRLLRDHFALRQLVPKLQSEGTVKVETVQALGYQGEAALDLLIEYSSDADPDLRAAAVTALAHIPSPAAVAALRERMKDKAPEVRQALIRTLPKLGYVEQSNFLDRLDPLGDGCEVVPILETFGDWRRVAATYLMKRMGESAIGPLLRALRQGPMKLRIAAAGYLEEIIDDRAVPALVEQLGTRNTALRGAVVKALFKQRVPPELFKDLLRDRSRRVRAVARTALENYR